VLNQALRYLKMGLSVIPLRQRGKEPLIPWTEFQTRRMTEEEAKRHFAVPNVNIGIVTGKISGIVVIDLDGPEGLESAKKLNIHTSVQSITGNGKHLWFRVPLNAPLIQNSVKTHPGLDIRGEGGYIVAPPSVHESGKRYRWINALTDSASLPTFPTALLNVPADTAKLGMKPERSGSWIAESLKEMKDGNIDSTIVSILGRLRHDGYSKEDARAFLSPHMERVKAEDGHLEAKIENVWGRYQPGDKGKMGGGLANVSGYAGSQSSNEGLTIHSPADDYSWSEYESRLGYVSDEGMLRTGYPKLDAMFTGGLKSERLFTVAALTGHGKTNFGIGLSKNLCGASKSVLYFSTEFGYKKVWQRYIASLKHPEAFRTHKFNVCDSFTPNIEQVEEAIQRIKPDVFIFDYIQHVSKEKEHLTAFMKGCQFLQRKYGCQGVILAQLNRGADWVEQGKRIEPRLSMIEGSATIEQASSRVLLLSMAKQLPEYYEIQGYLAKNDDGDTGLVQFALYRNPYRLEEI
jgi:hypothetical protein